MIDTAGKLIFRYSYAVRMSIVILMLFATSFLPSELFAPILVFCGLLVLFISNGRMNTSLVNILIPFLIIFIMGLSGVFHHEPHHIFRDIAYSLTPISLLITGYWLADNDKMRVSLFKILLVCGFIVALIHIFKFILDPKLLTQDIASMRLNAKNPNVDLVSISLFLGLFRKRLKLNDLFPKLLPWYVIMPTLILSFVFSFSRTGFVILIVLTASVTGMIGKLTVKSILFFLFFVIVFMVIILTTPHDDVETFRGKIARSVREVVAREYTNYKDITINWRGHETWKALETFKSGNLRQKVIGHGFGAVVKLDMTMILAGEEFTEIPILHNGYAYILVKTGIIGIICYLLFYIILLYRSRPSVNRGMPERMMISRLLVGSTICLILTMFVIGGMAEIHDSELVLLTGFLLMRMEQTEI